MRSTFPTISTTYFALLLLAGTIAVIGSVLAFEHIGGYIPCKLCLGQREPYYVAIAVAFVALLTRLINLPKLLTRILFGVIALLMAYAMFLGIEHAGVEWKWWEGPGDCGATVGNLSNDAGSLLQQLQAKKPPVCDEAAGRFLGLSFAGWNVVVSFALLLVAVKGTLQKD